MSARGGGATLVSASPGSSSSNHPRSKEPTSPSSSFASPACDSVPFACDSVPFASPPSDSVPFASPARDSVPFASPARDSVPRASAARASAFSAPTEPDFSASTTGSKASIAPFVCAAEGIGEIATMGGAGLNVALEVPMDRTSARSSAVPKMSVLDPALRGTAAMGVLGRSIR